jgi:hypothetical protein
MGHANLMGGNRLEDVIIVKGLKLQKMSFVPADNAPLNKDMPTYIEMNPAGAVDVLMPAVTADMAGLMFYSLKHLQ